MGNLMLEAIGLEPFELEAIGLELEPIELELIELEPPIELEAIEIEGFDLETIELEATEQVTELQAHIPTRLVDFGLPYDMGSVEEVEDSAADRHPYDKQASQSV